MIFTFFFFTSFSLLVGCQSNQSSAIPLAVRSPYLQAYLLYSTEADAWPKFSTTDHDLGWSGLLRVDNNLYQWMGSAIEGTLANDSNPKAATLNNLQITPTRSILGLQAGPMEITVTFLSPIEPSDLILQSFPFTYIFFEASSTDGNSHSLQVYQDITAEWAGFNTSDKVQWSTTPGDSIIYHQVELASPQPMTEQNDMAQDAVVYLATASGSNVTYQTDSDVIVRNHFLDSGSLADTQNLTYRPINDAWPVFAFCNDLGSILSTTKPVVWAIGLVRDGDVVYSTPSGNQTRRPYFFTRYQDVPSAISDFLSDASQALQRASDLDSKLSASATSISSNYSSLVSLASRQVMAGLEITVGVSSTGQINDSDILIFMKDIGSSQRTNPVEVLYAALPAFLYFNASWIGYMLEPLLQYESSKLYMQSFAASDLGNTFPAALGDPSPDILTAIEGTSGMLIVVWAHAAFTGDRTLISRYYSTLKTWTETLIADNPLVPNGYVDADGLSGNNKSNLAISGILSIRAMAEISRSVGKFDDYMTYFGNASSLVSSWQTLSTMFSGHLTSKYGALDSWGMMYGLYSDKLFGFNLVDNSVICSILFLCILFKNIISSASPFGLPFDSNEGATGKSHWTLFTAGTVTDANTRDILISMVHQSATNLQTGAVFPTTYNTTNGEIIGGRASPAQGAMFALLALK
ncbi:hypothetical protein BDP27DRAFT_1212146 [Rhodocollybia butyracea]|uniref:DUF1793-domain-containing protein n=1 Tax=Rhodocollybia butyracea TaxID=206335 RepID=A0A9P5PZF7_9AGAR|nr:hypothetical protein BDP27DRAFT_1212146 [Rhodocollybia butyracea]